MDLSECYQRGEALLREREIGHLLNGVETGSVLERNRRILDRYTFVQRCIDTPEATTRCRILGLDLASPVVMSAMTMPIPSIREQGLLQTAEGLRDAGSLLWTGTPLPADLADLVRTGVPTAANVKPYAERDRMFRDIEKIQKAGVHWLGVEIDSGVGTKIGDRIMASHCMPLSFRELERVRAAVSGTLILKGVLSRDDAMRCVEAGADGVVVSNHGAHTLDYLPHPFQVMDEITRRIGGRCTILVDGGFRRGSDVLKGLAFGAQAVGLGRPILFALAADGRTGVRDLILGIAEELRRLMVMTGTPDPQRTCRDILIEEP
ncbi:MAG: alpha-hydroxy acid oxidase [Desulfobacteraceae bacterium]|jgi:isopentenyl diphosphate isomerase/L-lactate dehydrogenase-like FMN-dependent dehydrogenase